MQRFLIFIGSAYFLYKIGQYIIDDVPDQKFWEEEFESNSELRSTIELFKNLQKDIDDQFDILHQTPGYWERVRGERYGQ